MDIRRSIITGVVAGSAALTIGAGTMAPAVAAGGLHGQKHGYSLVLRGGKATLKVPSGVARHDKYDSFQVVCGGKSVVAFVSLHDGTRTFRGPYEGAVKARSTCVIKMNNHRKVAFRMHH